MARKSVLAAITTALDLANAVSLLRPVPDLQRITNLLAGYFHNPTAGTSGRSTDVIPNWAFIADDQVGIFLLDGIENAKQGANIFAGWALGALGTNANPFNQNFADAATSILASVAQAGIGIPVNVLVGGLSWGGMIGNVLAGVRSQQVHLGTPWELHTYGAGRSTGHSGALSTVQLNQVYRWFSDTDPFSMNPPTPRFAPAIMFLVPPASVIRMSHFSHPGGGLSLDVNGGIQEAEHANLSAVQFQVSFADWLAGVENDPINSHFLGEVIRRLGLAQRNARPRGLIPNGPVERQRPVTLQNVLRIAQTTAGMVRQLSAKQLSSGQFFPPEYIFSVAKEGGVWKVFFSGNDVAWCGQRRSARALAFALNHAMKQLVRQAVVDPVHAANAVQTILTGAGAVAGGFIPRMNVVPPS